MKNFLSRIGKTTDERFSSFGLLILRVGFGTVMAFNHGLSKLTNYSVYAAQFADPYGLGPGLSLSLSIFAEFFCSILIIFGAFTRLALIPLIINMLTALLIIHADDPFAKKELALLYLISYLTLFFAGAGKYSVDGAINRTNKKQIVL